MKTNTSLLTPLFILLLFSCKKEPATSSFVGKWLLQEQFNGYANGGDFKWNTVQRQYQTTIEFQADGSYIESNPSNFAPGQCNGKYTLTASKVTVYSNCTTSPIEFNVQVSNNQLIITHKVREGEIKERFIKI